MRVADPDREDTLLLDLPSFVVDITYILLNGLSEEPYFKIFVLLLLSSLFLRSYFLFFFKVVSTVVRLFY